MMDHHAHKATGRASQAGLRFAALLTSITFLAEVAGGFWTNSLALLSDSGHVFMDLTAIFFSFSAIKLAERPASSRRTFGFHRLEVFAAFLNGLLVTGIAALIVFESIQRLKHPQTIKSGPMLVIAVLGLAVNLIVAWRLRGSAKSDINMRGAFLHVIGDALASVGVVTGGLLIYFTGKTFIDPCVGLFVSFIIAINAVSLLKDSLHILLEGVPKDINLEDVVAAMRAVPGVTSVDDTHLWNICSHLRSLSAHITLPPDQKDKQEPVLKNVLETLKTRFNIRHATIQVRFADWEPLEADRESD